MSSSKATKRDNSFKGKAQVTDPLPSSMDTDNRNDTNPTTENTAQTCSSTARHAQNHTHSHDKQTPVGDARRKSTDSDLMTWAHLSVDRSGARIRTICTQDHVDGETCSHTVHERRYRDIPRVDGPSEKITVEDVEAMMARDARVEREGEGEGEGEEGWIVIGRN